MASGSPQTSLNRSAPPSRPSWDTARAVRVSCHTIALCTGRPVAASQTTAVSRWLVMPTAAIVTSVLLVYGAGNLAWRNDAVALALAAVAAALVWLVLRRFSRRAPEGARLDSTVPVGSPHEAAIVPRTRRQETA